MSEKPVTGIEALRLMAAKLEAVRQDLAAGGGPPKAKLPTKKRSVKASEFFPTSKWIGDIDRELGRAAEAAYVAGAKVPEQWRARHGKCGALYHELPSEARMYRTREWGYHVNRALARLLHEVNGLIRSEEARGERRAAQTQEHVPDHQQEAACPCGLKHGTDFASVTFKGKHYHLTANERYGFRHLHTNALKGIYEVGLYELAEAMSSQAEQPRGRDLFKTSGLWQAGLIVKGSRKASVRINLPKFS